MWFGVEEREILETENEESNRKALKERNREKKRSIQFGFNSNKVFFKSLKKETKQKRCSKFGCFLFLSF